MPSFLSPVLPATPGLALGSPAMPWTVYASNAYVTGTGIPLNALSAAVAGNTINNGSTEQIWQWTLTGGTPGMNIGEGVASTAPFDPIGNGPVILDVYTIPGSTVGPFRAVIRAGTGAPTGLGITPAGDIHAIGGARFIDAAGNIISGTPSDYRLKENIESLGSARERVQKLHPVTFNFKDDETGRVGFIAHEVQEVLPSGATGEKDELTADGKIKPQQLNLIDIVALLTKAVQELAGQVDELSRRS